MREVLGHFLKLKSSGEGVPDASSQSRRDAPRRRSVADRAGVTLIFSRISARIGQLSRCPGLLSPFPGSDSGPCLQAWTALL
jgi:hypothetical protein